MITTGRSKAAWNARDHTVVGVVLAFLPCLALLSAASKLFAKRR